MIGVLSGVWIPKWFGFSNGSRFQSMLGLDPNTGKRIAELCNNLGLPEKASPREKAAKPNEPGSR
ncbi:MAG: hypothetical protein VKO39_03190 [Cyanobacteriota bacterium]|nr:hypothetical protein [Cyanobacteriota bacterium]